MLSPTISVSAADSSTSPTTHAPSGTRRRGLSYLRSLSSHNSANSSEPRTSPRSFFQRSTSYNDNNKKATGRRRSVSKPDEPTAATLERGALTRVTSAGGAHTAAPAPPEDSSSGDDARQSRSRHRDSQNTEDEMTRARQSNARRLSGSAGAEAAGNQSAATNTGDESKQQMPMIRLFPHQDLRSGRQSLHFDHISRTLPSDKAIIRVGRYSEREGLPIANPNGPSDAPVGFKSKVVSRRHCEFLFVDGQWQIRDVASSSGTFLNHIRLSQPNQESKLFPIKDGDIVQLGIDFRGGEEMIFRCVKIRIECNRSWQKKPNAFNKTRRAQLLGLVKDQPTAGSNSGECSICLGSVLPCQSLFVAPCAHVWHYKCIRPMLEGRQSQYPQFQCPNCRAYTDLEADVDVADDDMEEWMEEAADTDEHVENEQTDRPLSQATPPQSEATSSVREAALPDSASGSLLARRAAANPSSPDIQAMGGIDIPGRRSDVEMHNDLEHTRTNIETPSADQIISGEGPLTPRNNAGPFIFNSSGASAARRTEPNLAEASEDRV